ncbi:hypothetical protein B0T21DRAFT_353333 [Apiosordaria backusii]|uniref:Uncharacterized protein n=1 Tax=Apiosordaria backusii TaxID=314023 RepID=A0AA39ZSI6_9PEZI|nr:hypothetical protein B0T21DRAFT_353333 [Apiosordaria backusii]
MDRLLGDYMSRRLYWRHADPEDPAKYHHNEIYGWTNFNNPKRRKGDSCKECKKKNRPPYKANKDTEVVDSTDVAGAKVLCTIGGQELSPEWLKSSTVECCDCHSTHTHGLNYRDYGCLHRDNRYGPDDEDDYKVGRKPCTCEKVNQWGFKVGPYYPREEKSGGVFSKVKNKLFK